MIDKIYNDKHPFTRKCRGVFAENNNDLEFLYYTIFLLSTT